VEENMPAESGKKLMKMAELVKRTGVEKQAIHFYINKGLLPRPLKTKKNVAFYDETYVERIRLIKELQLKRFLPLSVIKEIIDQTDGDLSISEIDVIKVTGKEPRSLLDIDEHPGPLTLSELSKRTGLCADEIEEMERCEMISSSKNKGGAKVYEGIDVRIAEDFSEVRKAGLTEDVGFSVEDFRLQTDLINILAIEEVKVFARKFAKRFPEDAQELLPQIAKNSAMALAGFISSTRQKKMLEALQAFSEGGVEALDQVGGGPTP
jgi:DNA-binding transcriptional MerR regulator